VLDRAAIQALIPHHGAMCLLDSVAGWSEREIDCRSASHLDPANPLRRDGRLHAVCGVEYGLQAAALHGALRGGCAPQPPGYVAALRGLIFRIERLDDPGHGVLTVAARMEHADPSGIIYGFQLFSSARLCLLEGRGIVVFRA
jgi:predicted hotdog family 3-hydroxylacyl-ACP dehydratase